MVACRRIETTIDRVRLCRRYMQRQCDLFLLQVNAALQLRLHKLYILDVDPAIIDLTYDEPAASSSSIKSPESTPGPKKRQRDPDVVEVDSL